MVFTTLPRALFRPVWKSMKHFNVSAIQRPPEVCILASFLENAREREREKASLAQRKTERGRVPVPCGYNMHRCTEMLSGGVRIGDAHATPHGRTWLALYLFYSAPFLRFSLLPTKINKGRGRSICRTRVVLLRSHRKSLFICHEARETAARPVSSVALV